ncbi:MAG: hypothetical protein RLZZ126_51 [Pseudomonadota bacterium]|jgi:tripartite-type tricarboxylate transporter receptor subunit TctC
MLTLSTRRHFLRLSAATVATHTWALPATAQTPQPLEVTRVFCGYPAGSTVDVVSRKLADHLSRSYAKAAIVDNKAGAAGRMAVEALKLAASDGSAMLVTPGSVVTMYPHIYPTLSYDIFRDLTPVGMIASTEFCLAVGPAVPAAVRSFDEFSAWCKSNPAQASCGNAGAGSFPHFMALLLARDTGIPLTHVPYRGGSAAMLALAGGEVASVLATEGAALPLEKAGKLRVLATSSADRSLFFPKASTFQELGYANLVQREWFGVFMPRNVPQGKTAVVAQEIKAMMASPDVRETWSKIGFAPTSSSPAELLAAQKKEFDFWGPIIKTSGFKPES